MAGAEDGPSLDLAEDEGVGAVAFSSSWPELAAARRRRRRTERAVVRFILTEVLFRLRGNEEKNWPDMEEEISW